MGNERLSFGRLFFVDNNGKKMCVRDGDLMRMVKADRVCWMSFVLRLLVDSSFGFLLFGVMCALKIVWKSKLFKIKEYFIRY